MSNYNSPCMACRIVMTKELFVSCNKTSYYGRIKNIFFLLLLWNGISRSFLSHPKRRIITTDTHHLLLQLYDSCCFREGIITWKKVTMALLFSQQYPLDKTLLDDSLQSMVTFEPAVRMVYAIKPAVSDGFVFLSTMF